MENFYDFLRFNYDLYEFINLNYNGLAIPYNTKPTNVKLEFDFDQSILNSYYKYANLKAIFRYAPLSEENIEVLLKEYGSLLDFDYSHELSENRNIKWNYSIIERFKNIIAWKILARNPSVPWDEFLIDKYIVRNKKEKYIFIDLSSNPTINWNISLLKKYWKDLLLNCIVKHNSLFWDTELLSNTLDLVSTEYKRHYLVLFAESKNTIWSLELLIKNPIDYSYWVRYIIRNETIILTFEELKINKERISEKLFLEIQTCKTLLWNIEMVEHFQDLLNFEILSSSSNVKWDLDLINKFKSKLNFDMLCKNNSINFNLEQFKIDGIELNYFNLSKNCNVIWNRETIKDKENEISLIDILRLSTLKEIDSDFIHKYRHMINWKGKYVRFGSDSELYNACTISQLNHIPIRVDTLLEMSSNWREADNYSESFDYYGEWYYFSCNNFLTNDHLDIFKDKLNWYNISSNESIKIDVDFINRYSFYIKWNKLMLRKDLNYEIIFSSLKFLNSYVLENHKESILNILDQHKVEIYNYINFGPRYSPINTKYQANIKNYFHWAEYVNQKNKYLENHIAQYQSEIASKAIDEYNSNSLTEESDMPSLTDSWLSRYFSLFQEISKLDKNIEIERIYSNKTNVNIFFGIYERVLNRFKNNYKENFK